MARRLSVVPKKRSTAAIAEQYRHARPGQACATGCSELIMHAGSKRWSRAARRSLAMSERGVDPRPTLLAAAHQRNVLLRARVLAFGGVGGRTALEPVRRGRNPSVIIGQARAAGAATTPAILPRPWPRSIATCARRGDVWALGGFDPAESGCDAAMTVAGTRCVAARLSAKPIEAGPRHDGAPVAETRTFTSATKPYVGSGGGVPMSARGGAMEGNFVICWKAYANSRQMAARHQRFTGDLSLEPGFAGVWRVVEPMRKRFVVRV